MRGFTELPEVGGAGIRKFLLLAVGPDILDRIQVLRIGGKVFYIDLSLQAVEVIADERAALRRQASPNQDQRTAKCRTRALQKPTI